MRYVFLLIFVFVNIVNAQQVETESFLKGANISAIAEEENNFWVSTYGEGIYRYSKKTGEWFNYSTSSKNLEHDLFYNLAVSPKYIWAGTSEGLFVLDRKKNKWRKINFSSGGQWGQWIRSLCYDPYENVLWIGRFVNLTKYDLKTNKFKDYNLTIGKDLKSNNIKVIKLEGDSLVWFGTESGVHIYNKNFSPDTSAAWEYITNKKRGFNEEGEAVSISDILFENNYIWFGTDEFITADRPEFNVGGLYRYNRRLQWIQMTERDGLPANGIFKLARTGNEIWVSLYYFDKEDKKEYGKGIALVNRISGRIKILNLNNTDITTSQFNVLYFDGKNMWLGTDKGLWKIKIENEFAKWQSPGNENQSKEQNNAKEKENKKTTKGDIRW